METTSTNKGVKNSWSLISFARTHGTMKLAPFANKKTGECFKSCAFVDGDKVTLVGFSSKLGELTSAEIKAQKDDLQVVELNSGTFKLCKKGEDNWETVDL